MWDDHEAEALDRLADELELQWSDEGRFFPPAAVEDDDEPDVLLVLEELAL